MFTEEKPKPVVAIQFNPKINKFTNKEGHCTVDNVIFSTKFFESIAALSRKEFEKYIPKKTIDKIFNI
ncbi:MAG: hypothetical protein IJ880_04485 [Bacilli bacterium]|nr:hypothetical protein [Bacilli bacterium]